MASGLVVNLVNTMTCTLNAYTYTDEDESSVSWWTSALAVPVDGGSGSTYRGYQGFWNTEMADTTADSGTGADLPTLSMGNYKDSTATDYAYGLSDADKNDITVSLQLTGADLMPADLSTWTGSDLMSGGTNGVFKSVKMWPWDTHANQATDVSLVVNLYGKQAVATPSGSTTRLAPSVAADQGTFMDDDGTDDDLVIFADDWDIAGTSAGTGIFTVTALLDKWGGTCKSATHVTTNLYCNTGVDTGANENEGSAGEIQLFKSLVFTDTVTGFSGGWRADWTGGKSYIIHS